MDRLVVTPVSFPVDNGLNLWEVTPVGKGWVGPVSGPLNTVDHLPSHYLYTVETDEQS